MNLTFPKNPQPLGQDVGKTIDTQLSNVQPRFVDTYILPIFLMWYATKSKTGMSKRMRRILFISGVYAGFRSYDEYKRLFNMVRGRT